MGRLFTREQVVKIIDDVVEFTTYNANPDITGEDFMEMYYPEEDEIDFTYPEEK